MRPDVEAIQQRVAADAEPDLLARRDDLLRQRARWARGAYGQDQDGLDGFELDAITQELRLRSEKETKNAKRT